MCWLFAGSSNELTLNSEVLPTGAQVVGRRALHRCYLQLHARLLQPHRLQADAGRLRVGPQRARPHRQPRRLPAHALREGPDAALRPLHGLLHGARRWLLELQLHGAPLTLLSLNLTLHFVS